MFVNSDFSDLLRLFNDNGVRNLVSARSSTRLHISPGWLTVVLLAFAALVVAAYFQPLPVLALVALTLAVAVTWARPFWAFSALLLLMPFNEAVRRVLTWQLEWPAGRVTLVGLWKEGLIALLLAVILIQHLSGRRPMRAKVYHFDLWLVALALLSATYILVAATPIIGAFGFRNYFEPIALLYLARLLPYSRQELKRLLVLLVLVAAGVAAFGIYQAQVIDFPTMVQMGYVDEFGNLPYAFKTALQDFQPRPRAISTVTGPNQLAVYLNLFILACAYALVYLVPPSGAPLREGRKGWGMVLAGLLALYMVCLLLTFSRGGLLALGVSVLAGAVILVYDRGIRRTWRELTQNRLLQIGLLALILMAVGGLLASGFAQRIWRGITGMDPAALGHLSSMDSAVAFIEQNPLGIGIGMAGPRALRFSGEANIQHTESTYLQFGMETGLVGMVLLALVLISLLATLWRLRQRRRAAGDLAGQVLTEVALVMWVGALTVFVVTPLMQNFLVAGILWLLAGFAFHLDAYAMANGQR